MTRLVHLDISQLSGRSAGRSLARRPAGKAGSLSKAYQSRREFAELLTSRAVERCQARIEAGIASAEAGISGPEATDRQIEDIYRQIEDIYRQSEDILREALFNRFKREFPVQLKKRQSDCAEFFRLIAQYRQVKKRTLFLTGLAEEWSREAWGKVLPEFVKNPGVSWAVSHWELNLTVLKGLGLSTEAEKREYHAQLRRRVSGAQMAVKLGLSQNIQSQVAEIFYEVHERVIEARLASRLKGLTGQEPVSDFYPGKAINA